MARFLLHIALLVQSTITALSAGLPVSVQGYVYCKPCKYEGNDSNLAGTTPLSGAVVRLECNSTPLIQEEATTNKNGHFAIETQTLLAIADLKQYCKVVLVSSSKEACSVPTDLNSGLNGAILKYSHMDTSKGTLPVEAFTVEPLAFEPPAAEACKAKLRVEEDTCDPACLSCPGGCCHCNYSTCECINM